MRAVPSLLVATSLVWSHVAAAQSTGAADNGTDPTKLSRQFQATWEHIALPGAFSSDQLKLNLTYSFGARNEYSVKFRIPVASSDVQGDGAYDLGDASVTFGHVFGLDREGGWVVQGELIFDTAVRDELGTGKNVLKGTLLRAWFLDDGGIFAPALVHNASLWGDEGRVQVSTTTVDLYYVPKLADKRNFVTFDPSINTDWVRDTEFLGLAVTLGRSIGTMFGGNAIVTVKPSLFAGGERPTNWGIELGFKVVGF